MREVERSPVVAVKHRIVGRGRNVIVMWIPEMHEQKERGCRVSIEPASNESAHGRTGHELMRSRLRNPRRQRRIACLEVLPSKRHRVVVEPKALIEAKGCMEARPTD